MFKRKSVSEGYPFGAARIRLAVVAATATIAIASMIGGHPAEALVLDPTTIIAPTGSGSYTDPNPPMKTYTWDFGTCDSCSPDTTVWYGEPSSNLDAEIISAVTGDPLVGPLLYKDETTSSTEEGPFQSFYTTTYDDRSDAMTAMIEWDGTLPTEAIMGARYLAVQDGNHDPSWYIFDILGWDGMETIYLENFWPNGGAISNIAIVGTVPVPAALPLFASALGGLGLIGWRRRRKARSNAH